MIKTSINSGSLATGRKPGIAHLLELQELLEEMPERIQLWNDLSAQQTVSRVQDDLHRRWENSGRFIEVSAKKYGKLGLQILITTKPNIQSSTSFDGGRQYNPLIASKIFLSSESGYLGRRSFRLGRGMSRSGFFVISHDSPYSSWGKHSDWIFTARVPEMGAFYYSSKKGKEKITIKKFASQTLIFNINKNYKNLLKREKRI